MPNIVTHNLKAAPRMKWARLVDAPFLISDQCRKVSKIQPIHRYIKETGAAMIIVTLACESARRKPVTPGLTRGPLIYADDWGIPGQARNDECSPMSHLQL